MEETNILDIQYGTIIHGVNCIGVWGAGLARNMRLKYPKAFEDYKKVVELAGERKYINIGNAIFTKVKNGDITVASCFTQYDVGVNCRRTEYAALISSLMNVKKKFGNQVYIPYKLGCGLGGGEWNIVFDIIERTIPNAIICKI